MFKFQSEGPIQVELVSNGLDAWLPFLAIVLSLLSIGLTLWFRFNERLKLDVGIGWSTMLGHRMEILEDEDRLKVEVTNRSRTATTQVTALTIQFNGGKNFAYMEPGPGDDDLPVILGPGESASVSYKAQGMGITLNQPGVKATWIRARAVCGHRTVLGKKSRTNPRELREYAIKHPYQGRNR